MPYLDDKMYNAPVIEVIWRAIYREQEKITRAKEEIEKLKCDLRDLGIEDPQTF